MKNVQTFLMMLVDGCELLSGNIVEVMETYEPEDGSLGYRVVKVEAEKLEDITRLDDGFTYRAASVEDNYISTWVMV